MSLLSINLQTNADRTGELVISGVLDQESLQIDYFDSLTKSEQTKIVNISQMQVDLKAVKRVDTAGLAWLINLSRALGTCHIQVIFKNVPEKLLNLAELSSARTVLET